MHPDPHDRRKQTLALTPAGTDVLRRGLVRSMERQQRFRDCMAPEDHAAFDRALDALTAEARRMLAERRSDE
jgi:DNA-binding MarR family transcriptional regulator